MRHLNHAQHEASASIFMGKIVNSVRHEAAASIFVNKTGHWIAPVGQKMIGEVTKARGKTPSAAIFLRDSNDALQSWKIIYVTRKSYGCVFWHPRDHARMTQTGTNWNQFTDLNVDDLEIG